MRTTATSLTFAALIVALAACGSTTATTAEEPAGAVASSSSAPASTPAESTPAESTPVEEPGSAGDPDAEPGGDAEAALVGQVTAIAPGLLTDNGALQRAARDACGELAQGVDEATVAEHVRGALSGGAAGELSAEQASALVAAFRSASC